MKHPPHLSPKCTHAQPLVGDPHSPPGLADPSRLQHSPGLLDTRDPLASSEHQGPHHGGLRPRPAPGLCHSVGTRKITPQTRVPEPPARPSHRGAERGGCAAPQVGREEPAHTPPPRGAGAAPPPWVQPHAPLTCPGEGSRWLVAPQHPTGPSWVRGAPAPHPWLGAVPGVTQPQPCERLRARRHESRDWSQQHPPDGTELG